MILAIDQGTTGTTCLLVDEDLTIHGRGYAELPQHYPRPGWVEHDPEEIWQSVLDAAEQALTETPTAIGITNQRETTLLWDRSTGEPVHNAIVWQDRRTAERCAELPAELIRERTGLVPDPYFSATKLEWLLRDRDPSGLAFGTVDTWLLWKLTGGRVHATDETNASRTLLCSLDTLDWDDELLALFGVPRELLPEIKPSGSHFGEGELLGHTLPIQGIAGDQQAALFAAGGAKATYGTGSFVLVETEEPARDGVLRTAAARLEHEPPRHALEGAVFVTGAAIQWLRDGLGLLDDAGESEALAASLDDNGGVYFVPALAGLGSPHWRADARGHDHRAHARNDARASRACCARSRGVSDARRARRDADARAPARRRRHDAQPVAHAVPGRRARDSRRDGARAGADRARRRTARARRAPSLAGRRALRAARRARPLRLARRAAAHALIENSHAVRT